MKSSNKKTLTSACVWTVGVGLCFLFVDLLIPISGLPGHQCIMEINRRISLFFTLGCAVFLLLTYLLDRYLTK